MSDFVPVNEDHQFDNDLMKSIEFLLEDNGDETVDQQYLSDSMSSSSEIVQSPGSVFDNPFFCEQPQPNRSKPIDFKSNENDFMMGYQKWSPVDSDEIKMENSIELQSPQPQHHQQQQQTHQYHEEPVHHYQERYRVPRAGFRQMQQPPHVIRSQKRAATPIVPPVYRPSPSAQDIAQQQFKIAEHANRFFNQFFQLNIESLNAQANRLGVRNMFLHKIE